jgi:hypothetical protein
MRTAESVGIATCPTTPDSATRTTSIHSPDQIAPQRVRAPARHVERGLPDGAAHGLATEEGGGEVPDAPWAAKSRLGSDGVPSGFGAASLPAVYKDADGAIEVEHLSNRSTDEAVELGSAVGACSDSVSTERTAWPRAPWQALRRRLPDQRRLHQPSRPRHVGLLSAEEAADLHQRETAGDGDGARSALAAASAGKEV